MTIFLLVKLQQLLQEPRIFAEARWPGVLMCRVTSSLWAFVTTRMRKQMSSSSATHSPLHDSVHHCICRYGTLRCLGLPAQECPLIQRLSCRYMADEARSLKAYGELPDSSKCLHSLHNGCKAVCEQLQGD